MVKGIVGFQADHARLSNYERELSLSHERHQSCFRELKAKDKGLSQATTWITELEADSKVDVHTLSEILVRSDHEHAATLEKCKAYHDLALRVLSSNALQQGREEGQCRGLEVSIKFFH